MEIPYRVEAREDTGLWNAKIGMWLFLASEVMLFGGFFSAYVFLRMGADYPWPENVQNWFLGSINTAVLIISSVTVVFAWVSLKLNHWKMFVIYMVVTIFCALLFLALKFTLEYNVKLHHKALILEDRSVLAGHLHHGDHDEKHEKGDKDIFFEVKEIDLDVDKNDFSLLKKLKHEINGEQLFINYNVYKFDKFKAKRKEISGGGDEPKSPFVVIKLTDQNFNKISSLSDSVDLSSIEPVGDVKKISVYDIDSSWVSKQKSRISKEKNIFDQIKGLGYGGNYVFDEKKIKLKISSKIILKLNSNKIKKVSDTEIRFNSTVVRGDEMFALICDQIDLSRTLILNNDNNLNPKLSYEAKMNAMALKYWNNEKGKKEYLKQIKSLYESWLRDEVSILDFRKINVKNFKDKKDQDLIYVPKKSVWKDTVFGPAYNTYFAIYYTITGLHALHVFGGAMAFLFFLIRGKKWYNENRELYTNRLEVTGLFWHFVDLVWIFAFPIFYLF